MNQNMTGGMLQLLLKYRFPVFISTKSLLIKRDTAILKQIDNTAILPAELANTLKRGLILSVSISTLNEQISNVLEPGAAAPRQRMQLVQDLKIEGFLVGVNAMPVLPFISDTEEELEKIIAMAKLSGADYVLVGGLTLFGKEIADSKTLYYKFLERFSPNLIPRYELLYGSSNFPPKSYQMELKRKTEMLCTKYDIRNSIIP
jgi:DNA repair photolyase